MEVKYIKKVMKIIIKAPELKLIGEV